MDEKIFWAKLPGQISKKSIPRPNPSAQKNFGIQENFQKMKASGLIWLWNQFRMLL